MSIDWTREALEFIRGVYTIEDPRGSGILCTQVCALLRKRAHAEGVAWVELAADVGVRRLATDPADVEVSADEAEGLNGIIEGGAIDMGARAGVAGTAQRVTLPVAVEGFRSALVLWCQEEHVGDPAFGEFLAAAQQALKRMAALRREREGREHLAAAQQATAERLRLALDATSEGVWDWDIVTGEVVGNEQWFRLFGYEPEEILPTIERWKSMLHPDDAAETLRVLNDYLEGRSPAYRSEHRVVTKAGEVRWHLSVGKVVGRDEGGRPVRMVGTNTDITEGVATTRALADARESAAAFTSNQRLAAIIGQGIAGVVETELDGRLVHANRRFCEITGYTPEELVRKRFMELTVPEDAHIDREVVEALLHGQESVVVEKRYRCKDGSAAWANVSATFIRDAAGRPAGVVAVALDITARKLAEEQARRSEERLRLALDGAHLGTWSLDLVTNELRVSDTTRAILGIAPEVELSQADYLGMAYPDEREHLFYGIAQAVSQHRDYHVDFRTVWSDGSVRWIDLMGRANYRPDGVPLTVEGVIADITERKEAEAALRESEWRYRIVADNTYDWEFWADRQGRFLYCSPSCERITGHAAAEFMADGSLLDRIIHPDDRSRYAEHQRETTDATVAGAIDFRVVRPDGAVRWIGHVCQPVYSGDATPMGRRGSNRDITEQKQAEEAIRQLNAGLERKVAERTAELGRALTEAARSEAWFRALFEQSVLGVAVVDSHSRRFYEANERFGAIVGRSRAEMTGLDWLQITHPDDVQEDLDQMARVNAGDVPGFHMNKRYLKPDGSTVWVSMAVAPAVAPAEGRPRHLCLIEDITERLQMEEALAQAREEAARFASEQRLGAVLKQSLVGVAEADLAGYLLDCNDRYCSMIGYSREDVLDRHFQDFTCPEDVALDEEVNATAFREGTPGTIEKRYIHKDGHFVWVLLSVAPLRDAAGRPEGTMAVVLDITARKRAEEQVRISEERLRLAIENARLGTWHWNVVSNEHLWSERMREMFGVAPDARVDYDVWLSTLHPEDRDVTGRTMQRAMDEHSDYRADYRAVWPDGSEHWITAAGHGVYGPDGELLGMQGVVIDIDDRKRAEERLRRSEEGLRLANAELERALRLKDEFLANMSHELRTPLTAILGMSESLEAEIVGPLNDKQRHYVQTIHKSGEHLLGLISSILDLAKISAGRIELEMARVEVGAVAQDSLRMIRELAAKKRLTVSFDFDAGVAQVMADERRLKQMLVNLLSNAVKFTPAGGEVGLQIRGDVQNRILSFTVWDTGIGIRQEDLPQLFKPFVQLDGGLARSAEGTGLGLALVSEMASLHGGGVGVESEPGKGSRFTVAIPWVTPPVEAAGAEVPARASVQGGGAAVTGHGAKVLMVDDTEASLMVVRDYLTTQGYRVITARDGLEGVAMAREHHPDVVLMDVMMPGLDGLEATRRMRKDPGLRKTPVVALTALAMPGDRERCLEAGMNDYLSKPLKLDELVGVIERRLKEKRGA